jgi:predicted cupin superfamily sugar epimerase
LKNKDNLSITTLTSYCATLEIAIKLISQSDSSFSGSVAAESVFLKELQYRKGIFQAEDMKPNDLIEHPEGGRFREVFRSSQMVSNHHNITRSALTHIYFSLNPGEVSRFHKVASDEVWNLYQGTGIKLYTWDGTDRLPQCVTLSANENCFCHVVPAGIWQAAEPLSETVLLGCSVAPGFEFSDFELIDQNSAESKMLASLAPEMTRFIRSRSI